MASSNPQTITVTELLQVNPTLRLVLKQKVDKLESLKINSGGSNSSDGSKITQASSITNTHLQSARQSFSGMFTYLKQSMNQHDSTKATPEGTKRNIKKVQQSFNNIKSRIDEEQERIIQTMPTMTLEQQNQVLAFWEAMTDFFMDLFQWVQSIFEFFLEKIKQGHKFNPGALKACFDEILMYLKQIF